MYHLGSRRNDRDNKKFPLRDTLKSIEKRDGEWVSKVYE